MDHHGYESETFGFISAFTGAENFSLAQDDAPKATVDYNPQQNTANNGLNETTSLYGLPTDQIQNYPEIKYDEKAKPDELAQEKSPETDQTIEKSAESEIQLPENEASESKTNEKPVEDETSTNKPSENTEKTIEDVKESQVDRKKEQIGKKRRRIVLLNDDEDDSDNELKKELLDKTSDTEEMDKSNDQGDLADNEAENNESENEMDAGAVNKNFLKAKYLLKTAVVIGPEKTAKKKKKRILESDEEVEDQFMGTSLDDIGLLNDSNVENQEEEEENFGEDIVIINDNIYDIPPDENPPAKTEEKDDEQKEQTESNPEQTDTQCQTENNEKDTDESQKAVEEAPKVKEEIDENKEEPAKETEEDIDAVLDKIQPMDDDDEFFKFNDSSEEEEKKTVPNDEYFGSPDKQKTGPKKRGPKPGSKRNVTQKSSGVRKRGDRYDRDFVDDSESSSYSSSISSSESSSESESSADDAPRRKKAPVVVKKQPVYRPPPQPVVQARPTLTVAKIPVNEKKDRFYDKSRNIPNEVYFGDVKVPLHVLHTRWNSDEETRKMKRYGPNVAMQRMNLPPATTYTPSRPVVQPQRPQPSHSNDAKLTVLKEFVAHCGLKLNYPKLFSNAKSNEHKCIILRRILAHKGMEGEPTLAKCKKIKRELQAKRESAELDKSVILNTEGRTTRRSRRNAKVSEDSMGASTEPESTPIQPEVLQTLSKIKSVIDSDSE